ncbi:MAG: tRNA 2-thiouridine(34) synthase MnmA [Spiroplasma sp.]|nr:tRNA 2-thiouridine(34) synthase MnmA [Spiroplasma sp.]
MHNKDNKKQRIVVGISGGVDSAVSAHILKKQGHEVIGLFMRNWDSLLNNELNNENLANICPQEQDYLDAKKVCQELGIELIRKDFVKEYWDYVFSYFLDEFKANRTPNPDIFCNKYIKFSAFADYALNELKADAIAMGHYAQINFNQTTKEYQLLKGIDVNKDQSYFLSQLTQEQLKKTIFPIGNLTKPEVRKIAKALNLSVANKKDSTGICFIGERNFKNFLDNYLPAKPGKTVDIATNQVIGSHDGVYYYTLGQRKGLNLSGFKKSYFVVDKDAQNNILYVANENDWLMADNCLINNINWISNNKPKTINCFAKFRYRQNDIPVTINFINDTEAIVQSDEAVRAITPGQIAAFYLNDVCLGSGIVNTIIKK